MEILQNLAHDTLQIDWLVQERCNSSNGFTSFFHLP